MASKRLKPTTPIPLCDKPGDSYGQIIFSGSAYRWKPMARGLFRCAHHQPGFRWQQLPDILHLSQPTKRLYQPEYSRRQPGLAGGDRSGRWQPGATEFLPRFQCSKGHLCSPAVWGYVFRSRGEPADGQIVFGIIPGEIN